MMAKKYLLKRCNSPFMGKKETNTQDLTPKNYIAYICRSDDGQRGKYGEGVNERIAGALQLYHCLSK